MSVISWVIEAASDVIEGLFVQSDLVDINLTDAEKTETAFFDSMANNIKQDDDDPRPMGKRVY